jgi:hypothetical protein
MSGTAHLADDSVSDVQVGGPLDGFIAAAMADQDAPLNNSENGRLNGRRAHSDNNKGNKRSPQTPLHQRPRIALFATAYTQAIADHKPNNRFFPGKQSAVEECRQRSFGRLALSRGRRPCDRGFRAQAENQILRRFQARYC